MKVDDEEEEEEEDEVLVMMLCGVLMAVLRRLEECP